MTEKKWDYEADVVVVGFGGAGAVAAITAHDAGAKVLILEKVPVGGGSSAASGGFTSCPKNVDDAVTYMYALHGKVTPKEVLQVWAEEACKIADWWDEIGIKYTRVSGRSGFKEFPGWSAMDNLVSSRGGPCGKYHQLVKDRGINVLLIVPRRELVQSSQTKEILGVLAESQGKTIAVKAKKAVVLCCGGFEFNEEMILNYMRPYPMKSIAWRYNTGDGIKMAQKVGADLWHMNTVTGVHWPLVPRI